MGYSNADMKALCVAVLCAAVGLAAAGLFCGCETDAASAPIEITPSSATINQGQSITFTASGGYEYRWGLDTAGLGVLSTTRGQQTTYTATVASGEGTNFTQTLTCTSTITGAGGGGDSTNTTSYEASAEAIITHL